MKLTLGGFAACAVLFLGGQADEAAIRKEKARLKGTWNFVRVESPKGEEAADKIRGATLVIGEDGTLEFRKDEKRKKATYTINPAGKPKEIDLTSVDDDTKKIRGIYQLDKDTLKICFGDPKNKGRPTEFAVDKTEGKEQILMTLERAK